MRRLLAAALLGSVLVAVPVDGTAPVSPARLHHVAGRVPLGAPASAAEWLHTSYEAMAGTDRPLAAEMLRRYERAGAFQAHLAGEVVGVLPLGADLDGDRVHDLLLYRSQFVFSPAGLSGAADLTLYSGRTGARRWRRQLSHLPLPLPVVGRVGRRGDPGLVLLAAEYTARPSELRHRAVGVDGRRGSLAYDATIRSTDGRGEILQFGGTFDAFTGGGTDVLYGRAHTVARSAAGSLLEAEPFVLDGSDGTIRSVRRRETFVAEGVAYLATGDADRDRRDDFAEVRRQPGDRGSVRLHGVVEDQTHWTADGVPVGWWVSHGGTANITGDGDHDVVLESWTTARGLLEVEGVTDDLPLLGAPPSGIHGLLFDGATGALRWDRIDGELGSFRPWRDLDRDGKTDVLSTSLVRGRRDGLRAIAVTGAGKELYRREATVEAPLGRNSTGMFTYWAGDLDGDRVRDLGYAFASASDIEVRRMNGLLLVGTGRAVRTDDVPLAGTLDGGTAERVGVAKREQVTSLTVRDGWRGSAYWTVRAAGEGTGWYLTAIGGARGRCDGALLVGYRGDDDLWGYALDGATGRVRWSRTFAGRRPAATLTVTGRRAPCR